MIVGENLNSFDVEMPNDAYYTQKDSPTFNAYITIIVKDSNGNIVNIHRQRSHSPTKNFIQLLIPIYHYISTGQSAVIVNTSNASTTYSPTQWHGISYPSNQGNSPSYLVMIQVGSGSQSNPASATSLAAPIANGTGIGQLLYGNPSISTSITVSGSSAYFYVSQAFNNNSGSTVTITEVGIITNLQAYGPYGGSPYNFGNVLVWYDVLSSALSIPNGGSLVIYYTFTVNP
jgi:hypothetical protein